MMRDKLLKFLHSSVFRLGLTYLAIIMVMSIGFSVVFYHTSYSQLGQQLPPHSFYDRFGPSGFQPNVDSFLRERIDAGRQALLLRLIFLNVSVLLFGCLLSYYLARRTLEPIEESMEAQSQFASDASHELKTPLTAIRASNEVALRKTNLTLKEAKQVIQQNNEDVIRLQALSEGLLQLTRDEKHLQLSPVSLQDAATSAVNTVLPLAQTKGVNIDNQVTPIKVSASAISLSQVVTVLLDNAVKYSPPKTKVTLENSSKGKFVYLHVRDQGTGIKAGDLPHIFQRFYRADHARTRAQNDGYGLGLTIAGKLIKQMHGEIIVESVPGEGSTFTVKLPLA